jgi:biopolymer transport protein ExbD
MAKRKSKVSFENPQLNMTPMIDVVFQLMIFFLVTIKHEDIMGHLDVNRPMAPPNVTEIKELVTIQVYNDGFVLKHTKVSLGEIERQLGRIASYDPTTTIVIKCTKDSPHAYLIQVLDVCAKLKLANLSVFSM